jgi:phage baseplate assembly protein W
MGSYSFKSSGKTPLAKSLETPKVTSLPIGIKTPLEIGTGETSEILVTYNKFEEVTHDNLKNLILTNWGERVGLYNFGANLKPLLTEISSQEDFDNEAIERIKNAVQKWMPFVSLEDFVSNVDTLFTSQSLAKVIIRITYSIPALRVETKGLEVVLRAI